jgi:hypothetical protein
MKSILVLTALLLAISVEWSCATSAESGGYLSPKQAGFHHCALIYDSPVRGVHELTPYVIRTLPNGDVRPGEWLFDAYLFLIFSTPGGLRTDSGPTRMMDWQYCLDRWFTKGRDLAALDEVIEQAARASGKAPAPRQVMLTIPYLNREVHDFGDVDHDGRMEDLATPAGRQAVVSWYRDEAVRRFAEAKYRHLKLWGFYWMAEGVSEKDAATVRAVADAVHGAGLRFLWIPWFSAPGWERWKELGFDAAVMQPNYAFKSSTHKGRVRRNRLDVNAAKARSVGMGVEMEAGSILRSTMDRQPFLHYLVDGAPGRLGYQQGAMAYYLETRIVEDACYSTKADQRALYERLADFVAGRKVTDPQSPVISKVRTTPNGLVLSGRFAKPRALGGMDLLIHEPPEVQPWTGTAEVRTRPDHDAPFVVGGWAVRAGADERDGRWQVLSVPLDAEVSEFEIVLKSNPGSKLPAVSCIRPDPIDRDELLHHLALGARYTVSPQTDDEATYGDTPARLLTDGIIPKGWGKGRSIGWQGSKTRASAILDLGREFAIERVEVHGPGGGSAGVNFPTLTKVMLASDRPAPVEAAGLGPMPHGLTVGACDPLVIDRRRSEKDADGHVTATFPAGTRGRYVTVSQQGMSWLMLSEICVFAGGTNVALSVPYRLFPPPTPAAASKEHQTGEKLRYPDDRIRLTDGIVAQSFNPSQVTGWRGKENHAVTVELPEVRPVSKVRIWVLRGGQAGILAPEQVTVSLARDATTWTTPLPASRLKGLPEDGTKCEAAALDVVFPPGTTAQQARIEFAPGRGWTMVSEIEVQ